MAELTPALRRFVEIVEKRHEYAQEWSASRGRKPLGYFCTYVPEEIIHAAGLLPVRILGTGDYPKESETFVGSTWCAFSRDCLAQGLRGHYDYLDGVVSANSCHHMIQAFDGWVRHVPTAFSYHLDLPWDVTSSAASAYSLRELQDFRIALSSHLDRKIDDVSIERSIVVFNENRRLLRALYELRKVSQPPISGSEVLYVVLASQLMDKSEHTALLRQLLAELEGRKFKVPSLRLMMVGSELDDVELVQLVESLGAMVVVDEHCTGSRYFWSDTPEGDDPLIRIAKRNLERPPCPLKDWRQPRRRVQHLLNLATQFEVDGVVFLTQKFCDPHGWDTPVIQKTLEKENIPNIALEITIPNPIGPLRIRLEAFVEMLALELV